MTAGRTRFRFYVNGAKVHQSDMDRETLERAIEVGEQMLKPADRYLMVMEDLGGERAPWFYGNDPDFGRRVVGELFPGLKLPDGEIDWQERHGIRVPPEAALLNPPG